MATWTAAAAPNLDAQTLQPCSNPQCCCGLPLPLKALTDLLGARVLVLYVCLPDHVVFNRLSEADRQKLRAAVVALSKHGVAGNES
ncbi:MAG: hypothetical protein IPO66_14860 [Rhodanobacteraceae bacterium]|nr:hypothetical protein [Rhodanobacteraceae bacterium]